MWWLMPVTMPFGRLGLQEPGFQARQDYKVTPCFKDTKKERKRSRIIVNFMQHKKKNEPPQTRQTLTHKFLCVKTFWFNFPLENSAINQLTTRRCCTKVQRNCLPVPPSSWAGWRSGVPGLISKPPGINRFPNQLYMNHHFPWTSTAWRLCVGHQFLGTENSMVSMTFEPAMVWATIWYPHTSETSPMLVCAGDSRHLHMLNLYSPLLEQVRLLHSI